MDVCACACACVCVCARAALCQCFGFLPRLSYLFAGMYGACSQKHAYLSRLLLWECYHNSYSALVHYLFMLSLNHAVLL